MRVYFDISTNGDLSKVQLSGAADENGRMVAWDEIVRRNAEANGSNRYSSYLANIKSQALMASDYLSVKAMLNYLLIDFSDEYIDELNRKGYHVDRDPKTYIESIEKSSRKADGLLTRIRMKQREIELGSELSKQVTKKQGFADIIVSLNFQLGWAVSNDILLSEFNAYREQIKMKNNPAKVFAAGNRRK